MYKNTFLLKVLPYLTATALIIMAILAYVIKGYGSTLPIGQAGTLRFSVEYLMTEPRKRLPGNSTASTSTGINVTHGEFNASAEKTWLENIKRRFIRRREMVRERCEDMGPYGYNAGRTIEMSFYGSKKYNIVMCVTAKSGATTWKVHLLRMEGVTDPHLRNPHAGKYDTLIRSKIQNSPGQLREAAESPSVTRIMTARHPLFRLVSAYRDKFHDGRGAPKTAWTRLSKKVCKDCTGGPLTFPQFLSLVLGEKTHHGVMGMNKHYRPYSTICSPCQIRYDYIFKQETFDEDLRYLTQVLSLKEIKDGLRANVKVSRTHSNNLDYYKDVPPAVLREILKLYEVDFRLFDYEVPESILRRIED